MIAFENKSQCTGCESCSQICPANCITMVEDLEGFKYPKIYETKCLNCGLCTKVCPVKSSVDIPMNDLDVYACINKDKEVLKSSSSGGVFSILAEYILKQDGVVFGAMYDKNFNVIHGYIEDVQSIAKMRGSKYVQSSILNSFKDAKRFLDEGKIVLFSGSPCEIAGLKSFLKREYENLITCDFICTGVPSPKIYHSYIKYYEKMYRKKPVDIQFRNKKNGWNHFGIMINFGKDKVYSVRYFNPYIQGHFRHLILRPSCYQCKFKGINSGSDIKLADYWNVKSVHPNLNDYNGVSLIILSNEKAKALFNKVKDKMITQESNIENVIKTNASFTINATEPKDRKQFFCEVGNAVTDKEVVHILKKYTTHSLLKKLHIYIIVKLSKIKDKFSFR